MSLQERQSGSTVRKLKSKLFYRITKHKQETLKWKYPGPSLSSTLQLEIRMIILLRLEKLRDFIKAYCLVMYHLILKRDIIAEATN